MLQLFTETDIQLALATHLRRLREKEKLSRNALAERSTVPAATIKKFELTGHISLRQLLLLWQCLDDLNRLYQLTTVPENENRIPESIEEVLKDGI